MSSRKIGAVLGIVFIIGLISCTVYARGFYERQKPLVYIAACEPFSFYRSLLKEGAVEPADDEIAARGFTYMTRTVVYADEYNDLTEDFFMFEGDPVTVSMPAKRWSDSRGELVKMLYTGDRIELTIGFSSFKELNFGETTTILLEKQSAVAECTVPQSAVFFDDYDGKSYVFLVERQQGAWGNEYVASRVSVEFLNPARYGDRAIINRMGQGPFRFPVVTWAQRQLYDGIKVRLYD